MTLEDFTTYDEIDPNAHLAVTSGKINGVNVVKSEECYVKSDKGSEYFKNYRFLFKANLVGGGNDESVAICGVSNGSHTITEMKTNNECPHVELYKAAAVQRIYISDYETDNSDFYSCSLDTDYYHTLSRLNTTLTDKIYSDSERITLLDSLSCVCGNTAYSCIVAFGSHEVAGVTVISAYVEDLELREIVTKKAPGISSALFGIRLKTNVNKLGGV